MVNTSSNIYITNKHLLSQIIISTKKDNGMHPGPCLVKAQTCDEAKPVNGMPTPLDDWMSIDNTDIYKQ